MGSPVQIRNRGDIGDSWSRINPESVPPPTREPDVPLTSLEKVWYCLLTPPLYWWLSGATPASTGRGVVERFFFFRLGMPPRGLLGFWEFTLYVSIILGVPAVVFIINMEVLAPDLVALIAGLTFLWAVILYGVYFGRKEW